MSEDSASVSEPRLDALPDRTVAVSSGAERRLDLARRWLSSRPVLEPALVLCASRRAADDLLRETLGGGARLGVRRATPLQLATELATPVLAARSRTPLGSTAGQALVVRAIHGALEAGELERFAEVARLPGFPRALSATLSELRLAGVEPRRLETAGAAGRDLERLLERFRRQLEEWSVADAAAVYEAALVALDDERTPLEPTVLWLDPRPRWRREEELLAALARRGARILVTLAREQGDREAARRLAELASAEVVDLDDPAGTDGIDSGGAAATRLERVQRWVFSPEIPPAVADDDSVVFLSASGEGQECIEIARRARDLARDGIAFDRMAILLRSPVTYLPLLEDALRRASIPAFFSRGTARPDPAGRAFLALLACAAEDFSATGFAEYLSLGQVPVLDAELRPRVEEVPWVEPSAEQFVFKSLLPRVEGAAAERPESTEPVAQDDGGPAPAGTLPLPQRWERLLVDASVVGGRERWQRRLEGLEEELRLRRRELEGEEDPRSQALEQQIEQLRDLRRFALPLIDRLAALPEGERWGRWLEHLEALAGFALRCPESVLEVLGDLRPMSEVGPVTLEQVRQVLDERLTLLRREPPRRRFGRIFVATLEEAVGRSFDVVFVPGLAEGVFPRRTQEDPLLLDELRLEVDRALPVQEHRIRDERHLLHVGIGAAVRRLVVSYPRIDVAQGRQRVPSFYALDILRAAEGALPDLRELQQRAARRAATLIGWPAPRFADQAIDDAEYDLAVLLPLLQAPTAQTRGAGQFLLRTNPCLARSLRARGRRWRRLWTAVDGLVEPAEEVRTALAEHRVLARSYSPTALQHFASCPYRFFLQAIVRLRARDELETLEQLDPLTRGSLFHETQFELFGALREAGLLPVDEERLPAALDLLDRTLDRCAARYRERLAPAIGRIWEMEIENLRSDLRGWLRQVALEDWRWTPRHAELAFGLPLGPERDPHSRDAPASIEGGGSLRGSIDLVEENREGRLRVTDHKTGRVARDWNGYPLRNGAVTIGGGRVLQPVLYALAADDLLGEGEGRVESGRLFYCTQRGGYEVLEVPIDAGARRAARSVLETVDEAVERGFLPASPADGECTWCDYRLICGPYEEMRSRRKPPGPLEPLVALRGLR